MSIENVIAFLVALAGVPLVNALKKQFNFTDLPALWLTLAVSAVLGVLALFITGGLDFSNFTPDKLQGVITTVIATSMVVYRLLKVKTGQEAAEVPAE